MHTSPNNPNLFEESKTSHLRMIILGIVLVSPTFLFGLNSSYATIALPQIQLSISDASWFASISSYAAPLSTIIVGFIIDKFGRRTALLYSIIPSIIGWSLLMWNRSTFVILLGQAFNGLTMGAGFYPVQVYAGECIMIESTRLRNIFMTWISLSSSLGTTSMLLMANYFDYRQICVLSTVSCIFLSVLFYFVIPESPTWLHRQGRTGDAEWSQKKLGIRQPVLKSEAGINADWSSSFSKATIIQQFRILTRPDVYKPIIILSGAAGLLSFCGTTTVTSYMINIIDNTIPGVATNETSVAVSPSSSTFQEKLVLPPSYAYSLISGACMCIGSLVSVPILPLMGMKKMLITSKIFIIIGLITLVYSTIVKPEVNTFVRTAAVSLISFLMGLELGPRLSFAADVFPVDAKGYASIPSLSGSMATGTANKTYPYLRLYFGGYAYLFYVSATALGIFYIHFFLPEVVGRTLDEINKDYKEDDSIDSK